MVNWVVIPYGPDHRCEMERLVGSDYDPSKGVYGLDWHKLRYYPPLPLHGYGYNGIYLDAYKLPDGRILIHRTDKYSCVSKFALFASEHDFITMVKLHNQANPEIDPETGRPFRT